MSHDIFCTIWMIRSEIDEKWTLGMESNRRFASLMCSWQICDVMLACQYGLKSLSKCWISSMLQRIELFQFIKWPVRVLPTKSFFWSISSVSLLTKYLWNRCRLVGSQMVLMEIVIFFFRKLPECDKSEVVLCCMLRVTIYARRWEVNSTFSATKPSALILYVTCYSFFRCITTLTLQKPASMISFYSHCPFSGSFPLCSFSHLQPLSWFDSRRVAHAVTLDGE